MTAEERKEAIEYIKAQLKSGYVDLGIYEQNELKIISESINALICLEQYQWERDIAIAQLNALGIDFAQKIDGVYLSKEEYEKLLEYKHMYEALCK